KFVVALFASASHARTVNTIHCPSGDGAGSPTRCIRTMSCTPNGCGFVKSGGEDGAGNDCALAIADSADSASTAKNDRMMISELKLRWASRWVQHTTRRDIRYWRPRCSPRAQT